MQKHTSPDTGLPVYKLKFKNMYKNMYNEYRKEKKAIITQFLVLSGLITIITLLSYFGVASAKAFNTIFEAFGFWVFAELIWFFIYLYFYIKVSKKIKHLKEQIFQKMLEEMSEEEKSKLKIIKEGIKNE